MGDLELPIFALGYLPKQEGQDSAKLYYGWGEHQQENQRKASQGLFDTDLSSPDVKGPWKLGNRRNYVTTGYIYNIPKKWANKYAGGKRLIAGRYRDGGQGTQGPSAIAYAPWKKGTMPKKGSKLSSKALLKYSSVYNDPDGEHAMNNYAHSDQWAGGAWIKTGDKQAMIFVGIKGKGDCWYGYRDGTVWPEEPPYPDEGPGERGWWSEDFEAQILFYRAKDLRKVAKGKKPTWWPQPYAVKRIESKMFYKPKTELRYIGGVAFDRKRGRLYVFEYLGDQNNNRPLVHVWKMKK